MTMDEIVGIAILTAANPADGCEYLFVMCASPSRKTIQTSAIPVYETGKPNLCGKGWTYQVNGDRLDVRPSLKISSGGTPDVELFHNAGAWSVKFERRTIDEASDALSSLNQKLRDELFTSWGMEWKAGKSAYD